MIPVNIGYKIHPLMTIASNFNVSMLKRYNIEEILNKISDHISVKTLEDIDDMLDFDLNPGDYLLTLHEVYYPDRDHSVSTIIPDLVALYDGPDREVYLDNPVGAIDTIYSAIDYLDDRYGPSTSTDEELNHARMLYIEITNGMPSNRAAVDVVADEISVWNAAYDVLRHYDANQYNRELIVDSCVSFIDRIGGVTNSEIIMDRLRHLEDDAVRLILDIKQRIDAQRDFIKADSDQPGCTRWYVEADMDDVSIGGICIAYNANLEGHTEGSRYIVIQEITKYTVVTLVSLMFPEYNMYIPKVNDILSTPIDTVARGVDADYIYVAPIGKQGGILQRYYGYKPLKYNFKMPCRSVSDYFEDITKYYKEVVYDREE